MPKTGKRRQKRGRPQRSLIDRARTLLWAQGVCVAAETSARELEGILGNDGRWLGVWSRYSKGLVSPSQRRLAKVDRKLPGTRRYFDAPMWSLVETRDFTRSELREFALWLESPFRGAFINQPGSPESHFWRNNHDPFALLVESRRLLSDLRYGLDALTSILLVVREAELLQDAWLYLHAISTWAWAEMVAPRHPVLRAIPLQIRDTVVEPLRWITFADPEVDKVWSEHVKSYIRRKHVGQGNFEVIDALNELELLKA